MHNEVWGCTEILPSFILISMGWAYNLETSVCNLSHTVEQFFFVFNKSKYRGTFNPKS